MNTLLARVSAPVLVAIAAFATTGTAAAIELRVVSHPQFVNGDQPLTSYKHPVWSSDGVAIAALSYPWDYSDPGYTLVGLDLNGDLLNWPRLPAGGRFADRPSFDPTQTRVAFSGYVHLVGGGLFVTGTGGGDPMVLQQDAAFPAWSPDGQSILVETSSGIQRVSLSGGLQIVTVRPDDKTPAWSPDGSNIVFSSTAGGTRDLWIQALATGMLRRLTNDAGNDSWPSWSPDGRWIAYQSNRGSPSYDIWVIASTGGTPVRITDRPGDDTAPAWSPDGTTIAFGGPDGQIWIATGLPDFTIPVAPTSWSSVKTLYRGR